MRYDKHIEQSLAQSRCSTNASKSLMFPPDVYDLSPGPYSHSFSLRISHDLKLQARKTTLPIGAEKESSKDYWVAQYLQEGQSIRHEGWKPGSLCSPPWGLLMEKHYSRCHPTGPTLYASLMALKVCLCHLPH